ncbi:MAG TPA: hypothetical protein VK435_11555 [Thermodesulfovibrionales bacterium]|nr:hypothetical protein [Thermodesulfovibrionales bacterium]
MKILTKIVLSGILLCIFSSVPAASELKSRYTTIIYSSDDQVRRFNKEMSLGSLSYLLRNKASITAADEAANKLDVLIERVETVLEMYPKELRFNVILLSSESEVQDVFRRKYGRTVDYIAFYSPRDKTIYLSVRDVELGVLAHEIGHVVVDFYYGISTPTKIHEVLAQYVETHLKD